VVLEEYEKPLHQESHQPPEPQIIVLSAKNIDRLKAYAADILRFLEQDPTVPSTHDNDNDNVNESGNVNANREDSLENIQKEILNFIADIIHVEKDTIDPGENFTEYGLDPVGLSGLAARIDEKYKIEIKGNVLTNCLNINQLTQVVVDRLPPPPALGSQPSPASEQPSLPPAPSITDIAHTLLVGREAMEERLAVIVTSIPELKEKLTRFGRENEEEDIEGLFRGNPEGSNSIPGFLLEGNEGKVYLDTIIRERKLEKLAKLWVSGVDIDWNLLYRRTTPARISLPTYPFARERYWVTADKPVKTTGASQDPGISQPQKDDGVKDNGKTLRDDLFVHEPPRRKEMLESFLSEEITQMLRLSPTQKLDPAKPLVKVGLDSLMALQLKKKIDVELREDVSMIKFLGGESIVDLANMLHRHLFEKSTGISPPSSTDKKEIEEVESYELQQNDLMEGVL
jgi:acyl carrier protein